MKKRLDAKIGSELLELINSGQFTEEDRPNFVGGVNTALEALGYIGAFRRGDDWGLVYYEGGFKK